MHKLIAGSDGLSEVLVNYYHLIMISSEAWVWQAQVLDNNNEVDEEKGNDEK